MIQLPLPPDDYSFLNQLIWPDDFTVLSTLVLRLQYCSHET